MQENWQRRGAQASYLLGSWRRTLRRTGMSALPANLKFEICDFEISDLRSELSELRLAQLRDMRSHSFTKRLQIVATLETRNDAAAAGLLRPVLNRARE